MSKPKITLQVITAAIREKHRCTQNEALLYATTFFDSIRNLLVSEKGVNITSTLKLNVRHKAARKARDLQTNTAMVIPARNTVKLRLSPLVKEPLLETTGMSSEFFKTNRGMGIPLSVSWTIVAVIRDAINTHTQVEVRGFGSIHYTKTKAYTGRNPATGEPVPVPAKTNVLFRASPTLLSILND